MRMMDTIKRFPPHGWAGLALIVVFWALNWSLEGLRTHWGFFPLWLGYILLVDGLVYFRKGASPVTRSLAGFAAMFLISAPAWWLFELINYRTQNWVYIGREHFSDLAYALLASLSFSTVIPAVFVTAELIGTLDWVRNRESGKVLTLPPAAMFALGTAMLAALIIWPRWFYPFVWLSVFFLIEPLNRRMGNPTLSSRISSGDWRPLIALALGGLICGFFWELWNYFSYPKWIYQIPFFGFGHIFEMPILGYGGYIPFAWELWAIYHLLSGALRKSGWQPSVIRFDWPGGTI